MWNDDLIKIDDNNDVIGLDEQYGVEY